MKTKHLFLMIAWFSVSAVSAFSITVSVALADKTKAEYNHLVETSAKIQIDNYELIVSLESEFTDLYENLAEMEQREEFFALYRENRPNEDSVTFQNNWDLAEIRELASDSLKGMTGATIAFCIAGFAFAALIVRISNKSQTLNREFLESKE
ncbi:MAG: hypothetical protein FWG33_03500 [Oscillospiraceae bacterium]|nr:hypothetical protein [Oscillospiraceae bacterium]